VLSIRESIGEDNKKYQVYPSDKMGVIRMRERIFTKSIETG